MAIKKSLFITLFLLGLVVRLYCMFRPGFEIDVGVYLQWMRSIDRDSLLRAYTDRTILYPPMYPAVLSMLLAIFKFFQIPLGHLSLWSTFFLKVPSVLFDIGIVVVLFRLVKSLGKPTSMASLAGALYWISPGVIYDGAAWGQIDSMPIFFVLWALASYFGNFPVMSGVALALALLSKPTAIVIVPLLALLWVIKSRPRAVQFLLGAVGSFVLFLLPFVLSGQGQRIYEIYMMSVGYHTSLSSNAWNLWWPMSRVVHVADTAVFFTYHALQVTYRQVGIALLLLSQAFVLFRALRHHRVTDVAAYVAFVWFSFFMLPTQMHERYAFSSLVFLALLAAMERKTLTYYIWYSLLFFVNLLYVFPLHAVIGRGVSFTTVIYTEWLGIYIALAFVMLYIQFFRYLLAKH